jgi:hypothetical protein
MSPGKKQRGGPRVRWMKGLKKAMGERVVEERQWMDREEWRLGI